MKKPAEIRIEGKYFEGTLPCGKINKRFTGIGATTSELWTKERNTILVFPLRAIAVTKVRLNQEEAEKRGIKLFYLGGMSEGVNSVDAKELQKAVNSGATVKICAVADSFVKFFKENQQFLLDHFHLLIDEVDVFQFDSRYRKSLYYCIDIYKIFDPSRRTMISATLQEFSDDILKDEPEFIFVKPDYKPISLNLVLSKGDFEIDLARLIKKIMLTSKKKRLVVAYNSIEGIIKTIAALDDAFEVTVLSSENSQSQLPLEWQKKLVNGQVAGQVIFMTSAYFIGIDILIDADVIVAANASYEYTRLKEANIVQIIGRIRDYKSGNYFLFNVGKSLSSTKRIYDATLKKKVKLFEDSIETIRTELTKPHFSPVENLDVLLHDLIQKHLNGEEKEYLRLNINNKLEINHFKVDFLISQADTDRNLYSEPGRASNTLSASSQFSVKDFSSINHRAGEIKKYERNLERIKQSVREFRINAYLAYLDMTFNFMFYISPDLEEEGRRLVNEIYNLANQLNLVVKVYKIARLTMEKGSKDIYKGQRTLREKLKFLQLSKIPEVDRLLNETLKLSKDGVISESNLINQMNQIYVYLKATNNLSSIGGDDTKNLIELTRSFFVINKVRNSNNYRIVSLVTLKKHY